MLSPIIGRRATHAYMILSKTCANFIGFRAGQDFKCRNGRANRMNRDLLRASLDSLRNGAFAGYMVLVFLFVVASGAAGQTNVATAPPVVEKAFIAEAGGDFGHYAFDADRSTDRAYSVFFADMKKWGRYQIVPSPRLADWVFQINVGNSSHCVDVWVKDDPNSTSEVSHPTKRVVNDDWVEVVMMDVKTMETRRRFAEPLRSSNPFSSYEATFDRAVAALVDDLKAQLGEPKGQTHVEHLETPAPIPPQIGLAQTVFLSDISENDDE